MPATLPDGSAWPRVSVVTPSYNQGQFIEETLRSVLLQGYLDLEYIVVDGGSTDESVEIIRRYADHLAWWVSEPDGGQSEAINKGFARATGDIVAWLNSDDVYLPGAVHASVAYLCAHPEVDLVHGDCTLVDAMGDTIGTYCGAPSSLKTLVTDYHRVRQPTVFLRSALLTRVGALRTDLHYAMDREWWTRMALAGARLAYLPGVRAWFRMHNTSKTVSAQFRFLDEHEWLLDIFFARADLSSEHRSWNGLARANLEIERGVALLQAGERGAAIGHLWRGARLAPWRRRTLLALLLVLEARSGFRIGSWAASLKRRLAP